MASVNVFMRPSPARKAAPEPDSWIPIESLTCLPELEELLDPRFLVDSGQTRAVKIGEDGKGYVLVDPDIKDALDQEKRENRHLSHKRWSSRRRTLHLKKRARYQKIIFGFVGVSALVVVVASSLSIFKPTSASAATSNKTTAFMPTLVPIVVEGEQTTVLSAANSMEEFKAQNGLEDLESVSQKFDRSISSNRRSAPLMEFRYNKKLSLKVDDKIIDVRTNAVTVSEVLNENNIVVDGDDVVTPAREAKALNVKEIAVTRVSTTTRTEDRSVAFKTETRNDSSLARGTKVVKRSGTNGKETVTITQTIKNGQVASEVVSSSSIILAPINKIVLVGTRNPSRQSGKASWYSHVAGTCAHKTLPMGTIVTVTNSNNGASTTCRVADRGPFGAGRVIDLSKDVFAKIASTSQGVIPVSLSW